MRFIQHTVLRFSLVNIYREVWLSSLEWGPLKAVSPLQLRVPERRDMSAPPKLKPLCLFQPQTQLVLGLGLLSTTCLCVCVRACVCVFWGGE